MRTETTEVLIVGGGLVGLSAALFLSWRGVPNIDIERHPGSSPHPRAIGYTARTMELYRTVGLASRIPPAPKGATIRRRRVASLAGEWFEELHWPQGNIEVPTVEYSPCTGAGLAQDRLEPLIRERATELGADVRLSTELLSFEQDEDGVLAVIRSPEGEEYQVRAEYLIAADGHRSPIRTELGIERGGRGFLQASNSILFRAPLQEYLESGIVQFVIDQPDFSGFLTTYGDGRWVFFMHQDERADTPEEQLAVVRRAIGRSDLDIEIITTGRWQVTAAVAERYTVGRIFLAGDAAHTLPPNRGAYSANSGIEDAHNLAWKLAAVLGGEAGPALLDSYEAERLPVAWRCHQQIFAREHAGPAEETPLIDDQAMQFGQLYRSAAVIGAGPDLPPAQRPDDWAGQPGTRAPHLWLTGDDRVSTLDLLQRGWVLFTDDPAWQGAAAEAGSQLGIAVDCQVFGDRLEPGALRTAFGIGAGGASLIRPDGYIAWRSTDLPADPAQALTAALGTVTAVRAAATA